MSSIGGQVCTAFLFGIHDDVLGMSVSAVRTLAQQDVASLRIRSRVLFWFSNLETKWRMLRSRASPNTLLRIEELYCVY